MSEEPTERFEGGTPFEIRVLRELANINHRLSGLESRMDGLEVRLTSLERKVDALEEKVDARLHDTRPIWEAVLGRLDRIEAKLDVFNKDMIETRTDVEMLKRRLPAA